MNAKQIAQGERELVCMVGVNEKVVYLPMKSLENKELNCN